MLLKLNSAFNIMLIISTVNVINQYTLLKQIIHKTHRHLSRITISQVNPDIILTTYDVSCWTLL